MLEVKLILCPIDFSEFSVRAYRHALSLAAHYRAKLVVQHIVELWRYPSVGFVAYAGLYEEFCRARREYGKEQLAELVKNYTSMKFSRSSLWTSDWLQTRFCCLHKCTKRT